MKVESVRISGFRSIEEAELENCGGFNVLIGKNNSGKSNILTAIHTFFTCMNGTSVVTTDLPVGDEIDFHNRQIAVPITITLGLSLTLAERDALVGAIAAEAPQMRNAVEGMNPALWLYTTVKITPRPKSYGYVSRLVLGPAKRSVTQVGGLLEKDILQVGQAAAAELYDNLMTTRLHFQDAEALHEFMRTFDADDWRRLSQARRETVTRLPLRAYPRTTTTAAMSPEVYSRLESMLATVATYEDFATSVSTMEKESRETGETAQTAPLRNKVGTFAGEQETIPDYAMSLLATMAQLKVLYLKERREPIGKAEAARLLALKVQRGGTEVLRSIQETVSALLGVKIDAFESTARSRSGAAEAEMDVDDFLVEVNGAGIREALRLVLDVEFDSPGILLVEEPEIHLHPALEISTMRFLKRTSATCQVFITTHSTNFLDTAEMNNIYLVSKNHSTRVQQLDLEGAEAQIPEELGIRLSSLFMYDRLVFVEGASDEAILREWASTLGVNFGQTNVGFIAMGGVRNFAHYATEATLSFLSKRRVRMWFLVDRDEKDGADVKRMQDRLGNHATLKSLSRREIENYLVVPRALTQFIEARQEESGVQGHPSPSSDNVQQAIDECADAQKPLAIYKRVVNAICRPVFPAAKATPALSTPEDVEREVQAQLESMASELDTMKQSTSKVVTEKAREVTANWQTAKLSIVLGDLLLDSVCKRYGIRFKKERDGARLASFMSRDEIPDELSRIMQEIGK